MLIEGKTCKLSLSLSHMHTCTCARACKDKDTAKSSELGYMYLQHVMQLALLQFYFLCNLFYFIFLFLLSPRSSLSSATQVYLSNTHVYIHTQAGTVN